MYCGDRPDQSLRFTNNMFIASNYQTEAIALWGKPNSMVVATYVCMYRHL